MKKSILYIILIQLITFSCLEEVEYREPIDTDATKPENISVISVSGLPGAARVNFEVPNDPNISHVMAIYMLASGVERTVKVSTYVNTIELDGFADENSHEITFYTVTKAGVQSDAITTDVVPLEAPIWKVQRSIDVTDNFGGFDLTMENPDSAVVTVFVMEKNVFGEFEVDNQKSFATSLGELTKKFRGLDTVTTQFKYFVMDAWDNSTDTATVDVNPLFETEIPKSGFRALKLPGDAPQVTNGAALEYAWDDRILWPYTSFTHQNNGGTDPHMVTFDMGLEAKLSRFWYLPYPEFWWDASAIQYFYLTTMKHFEIYGSVEPSTSGALDDTWILLGEFTIEKPSGTAYGQDTAEDIALAEQGINFELDINAPKVRYIRIRCLENWGGGTAQNINELAMYGDPR